MLNKELRHKLFFLVMLLITLSLASGVLADEDLTVSTTLSNTEVDGGLGLKLEDNNLDVLVTEEIIEENIEVSTSTLNTKVDENQVKDDLEVNSLSVLTAEEIEVGAEEEQFEWIKSNDKYKQIKKNETGGKYEVHEYETSKGKVGYQVFYYDEFGRVTRSQGYGVEAESRTWIQTYPVFTDFSTATSTTAVL